MAYGLLVVLGSALFLPNFALAESCPSRTTVEGTTVTFVGELTDMGGDETTSAWFEYGRTTSYGQETSKKVLSQPGFYCITVSDLLPATTYNYRAVAENEAGPSYGENKTFTTTAEVTVNIKANGSNGPITIDYDDSATLTWTSSNADSCYASRDWSGNKSASGSQSTGRLTSSKTYKITSEGPGGSDSDSVTVEVEDEPNPTLSVSLSASPDAGCFPLNNVSLKAEVSGTATGDITYYFDCTDNGTWDEIETSSRTSYTAYRICDYSSVGDYTAKVKVEREDEVDTDRESIDVYSCQDEPSVNIKANGSNGPITIDYDDSATLTWTSSNADSCYASRDWSGNKSASGSQSTGRLTSSKTYKITCEGPGGSDSDSVTVEVEDRVSGDFFLRKTVRNISRGTDYSDVIYASPGEILNFGIVIIAEEDPLYDVVVQDTLPAGLLYRGELKVDNVLTTGDIFDGLDIGYVPAEGRKTVTFRADVAGEGSFAFGQTRLTNTALVSSRSDSHSDNAEVIVSKTAVAGAATDVSTGWTNNLFLDSFFLPLTATLFVIWLVKSRILKFEEWLDERRKKYQVYKSQKLLKMNIAKAKFREAIHS